MKKKIAIVTGSRRGIGLGIAKALAREGYHVVLSAVSQAQEAESVVETFVKEGLSCEYISCDISQSQERQRLVLGVSQQYGRIDVLVNNAGVAPKERRHILETTEESFDHLINVNLKGTFFMSQLVAQQMIAQLKDNLEDFKPRIINISSISAYTTSINRGEYCISKAGIAMSTTLFADALAAYDIPVFEIRPGIIMTDMTAGIKDAYEKMIEEGLTPIKRFGYPEDVANCVIAVCSGLLDFATGQVINADGGFHIRRL